MHDVKSQFLYLPEILIIRHMAVQLSFWEKERYFSGIDVVITGSGIVGLNAALWLKEKSPKLNILVAERGALPSGASTKNAGFACFGSVSELMDDLSIMPENEVFELVGRRFSGLSRLRARIGDKAMDFQQNGGYEVFDDEKSYQECADKISGFNAKLKSIIGSDEAYKNADLEIQRFGFTQVKHMIVCPAEGQIDTGLMMEALLEKAKVAGIRILNGLHITGFVPENNGLILHTENGYAIPTKRLLICTNGFAKQLLPLEDVQPARAQVLITSPVSSLKVKGTFHYDKGYYYFRNVGDRLLFGGGRNLDFTNENTADHSTTPLIQDRLDELLRTMILPGEKYTVEQRWSGTMGVGAKKEPIVKKISEHVFCAVRMGGMGIALGSLTGEEAAEMVHQSL
jgi:glycine/D-amino acid oxidase-like deaminating enzyme